ncbi:MAG: DUF805 domain-containing protein [Candidatus Krumholzibacteria bacterium]|nr:DUF805 domain-containing protein [Candidatus Krumholzibacteria bacterium]
MNWYLEVLKKYAVFNGRARRREYWMFVLINVIVALVLTFIDSQIGLLGESGYGVLGGIYSLAILVPSIAVSVRRLHDTDRSGMWYLITFIPFGGLFLLYFCVQESHAGMNQYGANPKAA